MGIAGFRAVWGGSSHEPGPAPSPPRVPTARPHRATLAICPPGPREWLNLYRFWGASAAWWLDPYRARGASVPTRAAAPNRASAPSLAVGVAPTLTPAPWKFPERALRYRTRH